MESEAGEEKMENNIEVIVYFWILMNQAVVYKTEPKVEASVY